MHTDRPAAINALSAHTINGCMPIETAPAFIERFGPLPLRICMKPRLAPGLFVPQQIATR